MVSNNPIIGIVSIGVLIGMLIFKSFAKRDEELNNDLEMDFISVVYFLNFIYRSMESDGSRRCTKNQLLNCSNDITIKNLL